MLVVVGGHSRNIGKTAVVEGIIRALPQAAWTAMKITQFGHGICSRDGEVCDCATGDEHSYAITQQRAPDLSDTGRFLAAGAVDSWWVRTAVGQLGLAIGEVKQRLEASRNAIVESNSLLDFVKPDLYLAVLDYTVADMKDSARRFLDRADALVVVKEGDGRPPWDGIPARWLERAPRFAAREGEWVTAELAGFVSRRVETRSRSTCPLPDPNAP